MTVSAVMGEIVWMMSPSPIHKQFFISPFGAAIEMIENFKASTFPSEELRYLAISEEGKAEVKVV